ncbi:hypothetical protein SOVF_007300 [Spinacia oleracea]|nr:hypothetical protein SOVF_007300 [Spinacia oleracea]
MNNLLRSIKFGYARAILVIKKGALEFLIRCSCKKSREEEGEDCCSWSRVKCNPTTGHVSELRLHANYIERDDYAGNDNLFEARKMESSLVPSCLANLSGLDILDVGENNLSGEIPTFITGINIPGLRILRLRNNKLKGFIPGQLCSLSRLQVLDLGHNYLTGSIPSCLSNLTEMNSRNESINYLLDFSDKNNVNEVIKGIECEYTSTLGYMVNIDLSCNKLIGSIPEEITNLSSLLGLNLSYNQLSGHIPASIGGLQSLESLDLSRNKLQGTIPTSMGVIYPLGFLDLSYNNLSGPIPTGRQLQTFTNSSYIDNPHLCGYPLSKKCQSNNDSPNGSSGDQNNEDEESEDKHETMWFYLVVMSGFATGFWCVVGTLLLKKSWRYTFFRRVEDAQDWLYVAIVVRMAKLKNK